MTFGRLFRIRGPEISTHVEPIVTTLKSLTTQLNEQMASMRSQIKSSDLRIIQDYDAAQRLFDSIQRYIDRGFE